MYEPTKHKLQLFKLVINTPGIADIINSSIPITFERIGDKDVYTVEHHHHALLPWAIISSAFDFCVQLLTLDSHTDTREAFCYYAFSQDSFIDDVEKTRIVKYQKLVTTQVRQFNRDVLAGSPV